MHGSANDCIRWERKIIHRVYVFHLLLFIYLLLGILRLYKKEVPFPIHIEWAPSVIGLHYSWVDYIFLYKL